MGGESASSMLNFVYHYDCSSTIDVVGFSYILSKISDIFGATITNLLTKSFLSPVSWPGT